MTTGPLTDQGYLNSVGVMLADFRPNPYQPKSRLHPNMMTRQQFGESILTTGLITLPVVRRCPQAPTIYEIADGWLRLEGYRYLLEMGNRQFEKMPCIIRDLTDQQMADYVMEANAVRKDLSPIDLAEFYQKYLASFNVTQAELARQHGVSQGEIANTIRLLDLPEEVQTRIISRDITESHGRCLLQLKDKHLIQQYVERAIAGAWTVATLDAVVKTYLESQKPRLAETPPLDVAPTAEGPRTCRVCGCTEDHACDTEEGTCHWVEADLCSACVPKEVAPNLQAKAAPGAAVAETRPARVPAQVKSPAKSQEPSSPSAAKVVPEAKATPPNPETPGILPSRKLILTEMADGVMAMAATITNPFPFQKKLPGTLETILEEPGINEGNLDCPILKFLAEAAAWWAKDKKEEKK